MEERLTRGEGKVRGGRQTYSARHLIDIAGSACLSSMICTGRFTQVPAVLQRVTRHESRLDGRTETECERAPILIPIGARVWGVGGRRGRYLRVTVRRPSRIAKMATYRTPYLRSRRSGRARARRGPGLALPLSYSLTLSRPRLSRVWVLA